MARGAGRERARATADPADTAAACFDLAWSPDGSRIAFTDYLGKLFGGHGGGRQRRSRSPTILWGTIGDAAWSPNGGHLAFSLDNEAGVGRLFVWSAASGAVQQVTSDLFEAWSPSWDPAGDYLFYLSDRSYAPQISDLEWNYAGNRRALASTPLPCARTWSPLFPPENDEVAIDRGEDEKDELRGRVRRRGPTKTGPIAIEFDGLGQRVMRVPVRGSDNYNGLTAVDGHLLYVTSAPFFYGGGFSGDTNLHVYSLEDRENRRSW